MGLRVALDGGPVKPTSSRFSSGRSPPPGAGITYPREEVSVPMPASSAARRRLSIGMRLAAVAGMMVLACAERGAAETSVTNGPDVTTFYVYDISNYGSSGGFRGYSFGTTSCNVGSQPVWWCNENRAYCSDEQHPVIAQNLYRLKSGQFEQIGMSWLKHGFLSTNSPDPSGTCGSCVSPEHGGDQLGTGCLDTYSSGLNGTRPLGKRSEVNPTTSAFPYPYTSTGASTVVDQRVKVLESDVDPAQNAGALYWAEGQYVTADDAAAGNALNNASYRKVTVSGSVFDLSFDGETVREKSAVHAWQGADAGVEITNVDFRTGPGGIVERFEVARRVTGGPGAYHYELAVRNMNSDRAGQALRLEFPAGATISNAGFHDIDSHSGEPYSTADWAIDTGAPGSVEWASDPYSVSVNANALRWGTMYSFRFDADQPPEAAVMTLALFTPGCPASQPVLFPDGALFADGFECGLTDAWSLLGP